MPPSDNQELMEERSFIGVEYLDVNVSTMSTHFSNVTDMPIVVPHFCQYILYRTISSSTVRIWDVMILIPNVLFLVYFAFKFCDAVATLRRNSSPIFSTIFVFVFVASCISILRCIISMAVNTSMYTNIPDRIMWLTLKFFLLATELTVVTFGLFSSHLDSRRSIQRVVGITFTFSLVYSTCQGVLEFTYNNEIFHNIPTSGYTLTLFGHGGLIFWFVSSTILFLVYSTICLLPFMRLNERFTEQLPAKRSFYYYCALLACLDLTQAVGSILLRTGIMNAMCVVDVTAYLYFAGFAPLVYITFLRSFLAAVQPVILFSYKRQKDEDDDVNLPRHLINGRNGNGGDMASGGAAAMEDPVANDLEDSTHFQDSGSALYMGLGVRPELSINYDQRGRGGASVKS